MKPEQHDVSAASRLNEVLLAYVEAIEAGKTPDRKQLLAGHPELADELREFFAGQDQVNQLAAGLWQASEKTEMRGKPNVFAPPLGELGDFRLLREIGRGGMGVVYEAEQISLHRRVALKVLPFAAAFDPRQLQRFRIEAQAAAQLHHTNIVPVFAVGSERGVHYYAMQFIEGQSLATLIKAIKETPDAGHAVTTAGAMAVALSTARSARPREFFANVARLGKQAADALEHAHQMGIVHRDIKPGNLLLDELGQLWVTDFGLAQFRSDTELTATGEVLGTLRYASPEQARARPGVVDQRSDIYALGATLYELLTLRPIFDGADRGELLRQITFEEPAAPRVVNRAIPVELETIVLKALAKTPAERYTTAKEMADDLQRFLEDKPILARRPAWTERTAKWSRRHRPVVVSAVALLVMGMIALLVSTFLIANAYARERLKAEEARMAQIRAEENFQRAKRAVDLLTKLSEEELAGIPTMEGVRRKLLDAALNYYEEFLDQHRDDPGIELELARVARLIAELSAIQGQWNMMWLSDWDVQDDLKANGDQRRQIHDLNHKISDEWRKLTREQGALTAEQRQTLLAKILKDYEAEFDDLLSDHQRERLQQIALQLRNRGPFGFRDPDIVKKLELTQKQLQMIRAIQEEFGASQLMGSKEFGPPKGPKDGFGKKGMKDDFGPGMPGKGGPPPKKGPPPDGSFVLEQRIIAVFTPEQLAKWRQWTGEPFRGGGFGFGPKGPKPPHGK